MEKATYIQYEIREHVGPGQLRPNLHVSVQIKVMKTWRISNGVIHFMSYGTRVDINI